MPIRDFLSDATGDLAVVNGDFALVADAAAVVQGIAIRVKMVLGEYWLDEEVGVDWIGSILGKGRDPLVVRSLIKDAIASTPDVTEVVDVGFTLDAATRSATVSYVVLTVYSTQPIAGTVVFP